MSDNDDIVNKYGQPKKEIDKTITQKDESREEKATEAVSTKEAKFQQIEGLNQISAGMQSQGISPQEETLQEAKLTPEEVEEQINQVKENNESIGSTFKGDVKENSPHSHIPYKKPDDSYDGWSKGRNVGNTIKNAPSITKEHGQSIQEKSSPQKGQEPEME